MRRRAKAAAPQVGQRGYARSVAAVERAVVVQVKPLLVETATGRVVACNGFWAAHEFIPERVETPMHVCDEYCVCPKDGKPLLYAPASGKHACQDPDCEHAHGVDPDLDLRLPEPSPVVIPGWGRLPRLYG